MRLPKRPKVKSTRIAKAYEHSEKGILRPEVGLEPQFTQRKQPTRYRHDPSLDPELSWDINPERERGESLIRKIHEASNVEEARAIAEELGRMSRPFLQWAGQAERRR